MVTHLGLTCAPQNGPSQAALELPLQWTSRAGKWWKRLQPHLPNSAVRNPARPAPPNPLRPLQILIRSFSMRLCSTINLLREAALGGDSAPLLLAEEQKKERGKPPPFFAIFAPGVCVELFFGAPLPPATSLTQQQCAAPALPENVGPVLPKQVGKN